MKPANFDYIRPDTLEEAVAALSELGDDARVLAGGQSLLPMLSMRVVRPRLLIDISRLAPLANIRVADSALLVGRDQ